MAAGKGKKKIEYKGVWVYTCIVSLLAYIWYFVVLMVISPNVIELWEAAVSFALVILFVAFGYLIDYCSSSRKIQKGIVPVECQPRLEAEYQACKSTLRQITLCYGEVDVIRAAKGEEPINMKPSVISDIRECF